MNSGKLILVAELIVAVVIDVAEFCSLFKKSNIFSEREATAL